MTDHIEKEKVMEILERTLNAFEDEGDKNAAMAVDMLAFEIKEFPTADVAPVVHAEWIGTWGDGYANGFIVYEEFECSRCGCVHHADGEPTWDYCPHCGARMDGEEKCQ